ncbi:hypothetical protein ND861_16825 [Leptospira sp. 2 VSF19]|uniref:Lipoprotein n=1 Tax=Leptospira soteropolitanensis TaxID=2950025 RepID=A0AAW5VQJ6_9LEPT|nr:hypothetical protein [Leptospira soteropolitanensis]MCW7494313.1 hypothetical protein [Leptospira soteropolitanensis]MCW7501978.1 hypothetical protein [Leptospira soteropolitanensis]MCW7524159.1 hypothetical protein [Leptospira soteropolitanensis]MCW7528024.1 hypothetical protein [Leptospira soteropolitanensis]MCW7531878.1 hypothetical protein [Leptospira soteropolitanensis]
MKQLRNIFCLILIVTLTNCMVGKKEDACKYYLDRDFKSYCEQLVLLSPTILKEDKNLGQAIASNIVLVGCATYLKKKKECEREENRYLPGLYGMNEFRQNLDFLKKEENQYICSIYG